MSVDSSPLLPDLSSDFALAAMQSTFLWFDKSPVVPQVKAKALRGVGAAVSALTLRLQSHSNSLAAADAAAQSSRACTAALDAFLTSVEGASRATEPTEMRVAAVQALQASSLLQPSAAAKGELPSWNPSSVSSAHCDDTTGYCPGAALGCWQGEAALSPALLYTVSTA